MQVLPLVEIKHYSVSSSDVAKAVIRLTHKGDSRSNKQLITNAIRQRLNNNLEPVPGTFSVVSSDTFSHTISGALRVIRPAIPFIEGQTRGFTSFASNMFMDNEKSIWVLKQTDNGKLLVQTSNLEDEAALNDLMGSYSSTSSRFTPEFKSYSSAIQTQQYIGGDFAYFVNKSGDAKVGYIVASVVEDGKAERFMVLSGDQDAEIISPSLVLAKLSDADAPVIETKVSKNEKFVNSITASNKQAALQDMLEYYKLMFRRRPEYYAAFEARLKSHAFM